MFFFHRHERKFPHMHTPHAQLSDPSFATPHISKCKPPHVQTPPCAQPPDVCFIICHSFTPMCKISHVHTPHAQLSDPSFATPHISKCKPPHVHIYARAHAHVTHTHTHTHTNLPPPCAHPMCRPTRSNICHSFTVMRKLPKCTPHVHTVEVIYRKSYILLASQCFLLGFLSSCFLSL